MVTFHRVVPIKGGEAHNATSSEEGAYQKEKTKEFKQRIRGEN